MRRTATTLVLAVAFTTSAEAQELATSLSIYRPFGINDLDGELPPSAEFRLTLRLSDRFAVEPFVTVGRQRDRPSAGLEGFYGAQIRHRIVPLTRENVYAFATYGAAAYYSKYGSLAPIFGHFGFGLYQRVSEHVAFRPEVQLVTFHVVPIGARLVAGLSVTWDAASQSSRQLPSYSRTRAFVQMPRGVGLQSATGFDAALRASRVISVRTSP